MEEVINKIELLKNKLDLDSSNIIVLVELAKLYLKMDLHSDAINYLNKAIEIDSNNKKVLVLKEQIITIIKFKNDDIYANTNLSHDPWLD